MRTVVFFHPNRHKNDVKNRIVTRSMKRLGLIDSRLDPEKAPYPKANEHWLVEVLRENQGNDGGGCFILKPLERVEGKQVPLILGMYDLEVVGDAVIVTPHDMTKFWVMSPNAKKAILDACEARAIIIKHGGDLWPRRRPAESVLESEAKRLLKD